MSKPLLYRMFPRLYRCLFPETCAAYHREQAAKLRKDNRRMQEAAEQRDRCDAAAEYLDKLNPRR